MKTYDKGEVQSHAFLTWHHPCSPKDKVPGTLKMGPIGYPETSVQSYHSTLRNIP